MNLGEQDEQEEENEQEGRQYVILIPGGFKPPTGGHYHLIKEYDKNSNVRKVFVVTGTKEREGVTLQQSKEIFDVYGGFSDKIDFIMSEDPTPLTTCYELMKNENFVNQFPNLYFSIGAGDKGNDPARIKQFVDYFNKNPNLTSAEVREHPPAGTLSVDGQPASASRLRKAFAEEDWETFKKLLPHESFYDDVVQILNSQGVGRVNENFLLAVSQSFLVEGEKQIAAKTEFLVKKENTPADQAYAIANSMDDRGELEEELVTEQEADLIERVKILLANFLAEMPELARAGPEEKAEIGDVLASQLAGQLTKVADEKSREAGSEEEAEEIKKQMAEENMVSEMSAAGAATGYAGNAFTGEESDEQKRTVA